MKTKTGLIFLLTLAGGAAPAAAQEIQPPPTPDVFSRVTACRDVGNDAARLACFDRAVAALAQAQAARDVVVVDRQQVQQTRRSLFGLAIPEVGRLFGQGQEQAIEATITHVRNDQTGRATFQLDTGAVWTQTEGRRVSRLRPGSRVRIRRGALGSYLANVEGQNAVRVIRQR